MCGIVGEISVHPREDSEAWVRRACALMAHRGPDGEGVHHKGRIALGHRRLSVIDLDGGAQPMSYAGGRYWITYNGEIYNYRELRAELRQAGFACRTDSDTEVVLAAWACWGAEALPRLNGIFAFGLWDAEESTLVLARDPIGVKPLFYHCDSQGLRFGSELKGLLAHPAVAAEIDPEGLQDYLALGYTLTPRTVVRGVRKLPPGSWLRFGSDTAAPVSYWDLAAAARPPETAGDEAEQLQRLDAALERAVESQMVSDVPLGGFLSGGVDSSTISYYAARSAPGRLSTFSMGFGDASFDESDHAREVARHLGTDHRERTSSAPTPDELEKLIWFYDEPLGDTSIIPTYQLARFAREQVTVALSGDGADELFAGYDTYAADRLQRFYGRVPGWLHHGLVAPLARRLPTTHRKVALDFKIKQFVQHAHLGAERAHFGWRSMWNAEERAQLSGREPDDSPFAAYRTHYDAVPDASWLNRSLYVDIKTWLVDDILAKVDRASMAVGLEVRVPFLAPDLVLSTMRIPAEWKLRRGRRKHLLKTLMEDRLPRGIVHRRKRGFNAPVAGWLRGPLRGVFEEILAQRSSGIVDLGCLAFQRAWREHAAGEADHGFKLWALFSLVLWERSVLQ